MNKPFLQGNEIGKVIEEQIWKKEQVWKKLHLICEENVRLVCNYVNCYSILKKSEGKEIKKLSHSHDHDPKSKPHPIEPNR